MARCSPGCSGNHGDTGSSSPKFRAISPQPPRGTPSLIHNCGSPGCSRRGQPERPASPARYTQSEIRPADPAPAPGPTVRPETSKDAFSKVVLEVGNEDLTLVLIQYEDVQKYGGFKLLLFRTSRWATVRDRTRVDPHFYPDSVSCVARFEPTEDGIRLALRQLPDRDTSASFHNITQAIDNGHG